MPRASFAFALACAGCNVLIGLKDDYRVGDASSDVTTDGVALPDAASDAPPAIEKLVAVPGTAAIAADDQRVYVADRQGQLVFACAAGVPCNTRAWTSDPYSSGPPAPKQQPSPTVIALAGNHVIWGHTTGAVSKVERTGNDTTWDHLVGIGNTGVEGITFAPTIGLVYWRSANGAIHACNILSCTDTVITSGQTLAQSIIGLISPAPSQVVWPNAGNLLFCPANGMPCNTPGKIIDTNGNAKLALDGPILFIADDTGAILKCDMTTGSCGGYKVLLMNAGPFAGLAAAGGYVYWTDGLQGGTVRRCAAADCVPQLLAGNQPHPASIAVNGSHVYWAVDGEVRFLPR